MWRCLHPHVAAGQELSGNFHGSVQDLGRAEAALAEASASQQACAKALEATEAALPKAVLDSQASQQALVGAKQRLAALQTSAVVSSCACG